MKRSLSTGHGCSFSTLKRKKEKTAYMCKRKTGQTTLALVEMDSKIGGQSESESKSELYCQVCLHI